MRLAESLDHIVLFSGDGDFRSLVAALQQMGKRVSVVSTLQTQPPMVADELRRQADQFVDLADLEQLDLPRSRKRARAARARPFAGRGQRLSRREAAPLPGQRRSLRRGLDQAPFRQDAPVPWVWRLRQPTSRSRRGCAALCPRLVDFRERNRAKAPDWFNGAVPSFGDPAARACSSSASRRGSTAPTARAALSPATTPASCSTARSCDFGFATGRYEARADDGLELVDCMITNAVRCVPPENKPTPAEIATCRGFLKARIAQMPNLQGDPRARAASPTTARSPPWAAASRSFPSRTARSHALPTPLALFDSFHCSRYNTNTRKLTPEMFHAVFAAVRELLPAAPTAAPTRAGASTRQGVERRHALTLPTCPAQWYLDARI